MQIKYLPQPVYQLNRFSNNPCNQDETVGNRIQQLHVWEEFQAKGLKTLDLQRITGISRATYYRFKKALKTFGQKGLIKKSTRPLQKRKSALNQHTKDLIFKIRMDNPTYGKSFIRTILERDHAVKISESTVGRLLSKALKLGRIAAAYYKKRKARIFNKQAQRWTRQDQATVPGTMVQIDHMSVPSPNGGPNFKHFTAYDKITKMTEHDVYSNATSLCAQRFLEKTLERFPFKIQSIQVDGGSEFMKEFEDFCQEKGILLFVLPPRSPKLNGGVERCNKTTRHEFYQHYEGVYTVASIRSALKRYTTHYNTFRPHTAIDFQTPFDYYLNIFKEVA